ncbi:threonine-phosphate decarboxylase [Thalassotalea sp. PLHSN55]|uniref:threonine-phosphate decarboxylase n=1 Tax=Thalassotalea sp. PLHSN55 TaxID=3435888 RepID=UPI003F8397A4
MSLTHGGQLDRIAKQYEIEPANWLDLSTGIAPFSYPLPEIPTSYWQDLPTVPASLIKQANRYYQSEHCWPIAGSQSLIERLPQLWHQKLSSIDVPVEKQSSSEQVNTLKVQQKRTVYLPKVGYKEHQKAWQDAGYICQFYQQQLPTTVADFAVVVVINPNNPTTDYFEPNALSQLAKNVKKAKGLLVIDEAFVDMLEPEQSFVPRLSNNLDENIIILRSFGKFFGLAGLRIGFVCTNKQWLALIKDSVGPWQVNGVALYIAEHAFKNNPWQQQQKHQLKHQSEKLAQLLSQYFGHQGLRCCSLFITLAHPKAAEIFERLCQQGVYVRLCDEQNALRFGIPNARQLQRLADSFAKLFQ